MVPGKELKINQKGSSEVSMAESKEFQGFLNLAKGFPDFLFQVYSLEDIQNLKIISSFFSAVKTEEPCLYFAEDYNVYFGPFGMW